MKTAGRSITGALIAAMALSACETAPPKPMETIEDTVEVSATVEKVDVPIDCCRSSRSPARS